MLWLVEKKVLHFLFIDRFSFIFQLKAEFILDKFKDKAGRITPDELQTHQLDLQKTFIIAERRVSSDVLKAYVF